MTTVTYTVPAISCGHCTHTIETEVGELQGVQSVKADEATKKVEITFDAPANEAAIKALLAEIDYPIEGLITI
ncbi:MAG TPA: heavy-metal-associated domain-containing protein [Anaerolineales bacterium]|nr:heavy-metal-associated domain-containing protein [Anaerolineales bacterium]